MHNMDTIKKIQTLLIEQKKTQKDLCEYIGIKQQAFTEWKSGRSKSYTKYIDKIAEYLDVSIDYLLGNIDLPIYEKNDFIQEMSQRIKKILQEKNIKSKDMLSDCQLHANTLIRMDKGDAISPQNLIRIARYLNVSTNYLLGLNESHHINQMLDEIKDKLSTLSYNQLEFISNLIDIFINYINKN